MRSSGKGKTGRMVKWLRRLSVVCFQPTPHFSFERRKTKTNYIHRLPPELFIRILKRLPIENKFSVKAVCKKWHTFIVSYILPEQHKLSIEKGYFSTCRCSDPDHHFKFRGNNSISFLHVKADIYRKKFFEEEVTGVKVLKLCGGRDANRVMKYCLSKGPSSTLECLDIMYLKEPLLKIIPNLQHFSAQFINLVSLISVFDYCPMLTHLSIDNRELSEDFVDTFMSLPKGLQYLKLGGKSCDFLAVLCSPAMQTLESLLLDNSWSTPVLFNKPDARIKAAPRLQKLSLSFRTHAVEDQKMTVDFLKECPALKKIDLRVIGLTLEDYVNIYSRLSNLEMIKLGLEFQYDDVIRVIFDKNRKYLKCLDISSPLLNLESMKQLAEFPNLQTLSFRGGLVRILHL